MAEEQPQWLPSELDQWLEERAAESDRDRDEVLAHAVATYRLISAADSTEMAPVDEQLDNLDDRLTALETDTEEQIEDVRDRVVQVMQVARSKTDPDHEHPELADHDHPELEAAIAAVDDFDEETTTLRRALAELDQQVEGGFDNYEAVLSTLADRADDIDGKLDTLAGAVVDLRTRVTELKAADARRTAVEELQADANRRNVGAADCENCGKRVHIGLLSTPRCPHCEQMFADVEPGGRFFGSATLVSGDQPALTGDSIEPETPEGVFVEDE